MIHGPRKYGQKSKWLWPVEWANRLSIPSTQCLEHGSRHGLVMPTQSCGSRSLYHRPILWLAANCWAGKSPPRLGQGMVSGTEGGPSQHALQAGGAPRTPPSSPPPPLSGITDLLASTLLTRAQGPGPAKAAGMSRVEGLTSQVPPRGEHSGDISSDQGCSILAQV